MTENLKEGPLRIFPHIRSGEPTGRWQVDVPARFTRTGKRQRLSFEGKQEAVREAKRLRREIQLRGAVQAAQEPAHAGIRLREAVQEWSREQELRIDTLKKRAASLATDLQRLDAVVSFMGDDYIARLDEIRLAEYQKHRVGMKRKPNTINGEMRVVKAVLNWAKRKRWIAEVPFIEPIPVEHKWYDLPTPEEMIRIIEATPASRRTLLRFLAETGCRIGEVLNLTWHDVDQLKGEVHIRAKGGEWTPKTQHSRRVIPIGEGLMQELNGLEKKSAHVFAGRHRNKPLKNIRPIIEAAVAAANIRRQGELLHLTPHMFRKAYATWQASRNVPENILQAMIGHAPGSRVTGQHYIHAQEAAKRGAVLQLHPHGARSEAPLRKEREPDGRR